ncbi:MAG TPA: DUF4252 domain-containing protein [Niabella sp.]|nr:DUF4252 domain-containing protein [Chitinophagaceae bacterium]HRN47048.1 DUF4252 domain-containing protein [Niabella sp.]HRO85320.1 DUF4252 domain-containing protein [Niabella sp.]
MKKILLIFIMTSLVSICSDAQNDAIAKFFRQYENNDDFTTISISPKMFKMMSKVKWDDVTPAVKKTINQLTSFRMITTEKNGAKLYSEAVQKLNLGTYEEIMTIRDAGENVRFFAKESNNMINELVMLVGSKSEFVLMSLTGVIDLDNIGKLGETINVSGMENLKGIKKK